MGQEYIYRGRQTIMKPHIVFFLILSLNAELFFGDPCSKKEHTSGLKVSPWTCLGYGDRVRATDFAPSHRKSVFPLLFDPDTAYEGKTPSGFGHGCGHQEFWVFFRVRCRPAAQVDLYTCNLHLLLLTTWVVQKPLSVTALKLHY